MSAEQFVEIDAACEDSGERIREDLGDRCTSHHGRAHACPVDLGGGS